MKETWPPEFPRAKPSFCFFDNNCILLRHLIATGDTYFQDMALPVDVFHAKTKHKETDIFCGLNCNPAAFPELYNVLREWIFNSSAAEQVNSWFVRFATIVREMSEIHYNFFLDEMIMIHNEHKVDAQRNRGRNPRLVDLAELRP